jgi:predicted phosphodiesterase
LIYVTGDMHGDIERFRHPLLKKLKDSDVLIICGDFGFVWNGDKTEQKLLKKIGSRKHDTVFVEGCHDNYDLLKEYPIVPYRGGMARKICGNIYQLLRGEIYQICGKTVFAFGGGDSEEQGLDGSRWWPQEQPSEEDQQHGVENLRRLHGKVDLIITHDAPTLIKQFIRMNDTNASCIHLYLDYIARQCSFERWFFGRYHLDKVIPPRYYAVFQDIYQVE